MARSRTQIYVTLMILGGVALVVDRCVLSEGVTEPADASAVEPRAGRPKLPEAPAAAAESIPELPFPRNLPVFEAQGDIRDLFAPSSADGVAGSAADKGRKHAPHGGDALRSDSATFVSHHRLDGAMVQDRLRIAIVDGVWVRVGESIEGCELKEVAGSKVRFECFDGPAELILPTKSGLTRD